MDNSNKDLKTAELVKYRALVLATLDYYMDNNNFMVKTPEFDPHNYFQSLKILTEEHFKKGRLTKLKQWFRDFTEPLIAMRDLEFNKYLRDKTNYDIDIFNSYFSRIEKIIKKGKITTDNQFYDVKLMMDDLSEFIDEEKSKILDELLSSYSSKKPRKK